MVGRIIHCSDLILRVNDSQLQVKCEAFLIIFGNSCVSCFVGYWEPYRMDH